MNQIKCPFCESILNIINDYNAHYCDRVKKGQLLEILIQILFSNENIIKFELFLSSLFNCKIAKSFPQINYFIIGESNNLYLIRDEMNFLSAENHDLYKVNFLKNDKYFEEYLEELSLFI